MKRRMGMAMRLTNAQEVLRSVVHHQCGYVPTVVAMSGERFPPESHLKKAKVTETYCRTLENDAMSTHDYEVEYAEVRRYICSYVDKLRRGSELYPLIAAQHVPSECPIVLPEGTDEFPYEHNKLWPVWWWSIGLFDDLDWDSMNESVAQHRDSPVVDKQALISMFDYVHGQQKEMKREAAINRQYFLAWFSHLLTENGANTILMN
jgi:hypothetical protein